MLQALAVFLLGLSVFMPATIYAADVSQVSSTGGIVSAEDEGKVFCRIPVEVAFNPANTKLPSSVTVEVKANLKAIDGSPMPADAQAGTDGILTSQLALKGTGKTSFGVIEYTEPGDYLYELTYDLTSNSSRVSIQGRKSYVILVAIRNNEDGLLVGTMLVYPDRDSVNSSEEDDKLADTKLILRYTRPGTSTDPDPDPDPDPRPTPRPDPTPTPAPTPTPGTNTGTNTGTNQNPSANLPATGNQSTTGTTTTKTSTTSKPNTATDSNLRTYFGWLFGSGTLALIFFMLAKKKQLQE